VNQQGVGGKARDLPHRHIEPPLRIAAGGLRESGVSWCPIWLTWERFH